jgi:putative two-component system response regulator
MSQNETTSIVIVDDEEMVLTSLSSFLGLETDYEVQTFLQAKKALDHIRENDIDLILSDFLMPEMDGIEFLKAARDIRPGTPRIILTGYADKENAIKGVNEARLFQYVEKPWNNDDLLIVLRSAIDQRKLWKRLQQKISEVSNAQAELRSLYDDLVRTLGQ